MELTPEQLADLLAEYLEEQRAQELARARALALELQDAMERAFLLLTQNEALIARSREVLAESRRLNKLYRFTPNQDEEAS